MKQRRNKRIKKVLRAALMVGALGVGTLFPNMGETFSSHYTMVDLGPYTPAVMEKSKSRVIASTGFGTTTVALQLYPTFSTLGNFIPIGVSKDQGNSFNVVGAIVHINNQESWYTGVLYHNGKVTELPSLEQGNFNTYARCVNKDEDIFGESQRTTTTPQGPSITPRPVEWDLQFEESTIALKDLPLLRGNFGLATTCNDRGDSAGESGNHCTFWKNDGDIVDCHPKEDLRWSRAMDMTSNGMLIGWTSKDILPVTSYAWMWSGISWLAPLTGDLYSLAKAINDHGDIVGRSSTYDPWSYIYEVSNAIGWERGKVFKLQDRTLDATQWKFQDAVGISNDGKILVHGNLNGVVHSILLTPANPNVVRRSEQSSQRTK